MKLVVFEDPIRPTIQGDGIWLGTPMTFVRMHGCDYDCSFCDTKDSWKPGSKFVEMSTTEIADKVSDANLEHVSITGGNPLLQEDELYDLVLKLHVRGHKILVETQASIPSTRVFEIVDLASLGPKLHDWRWEPLMEIIEASLWSGKQVQIKVVTSNVQDIEKALENFERIAKHYIKVVQHRIAFILLPEYSLGRPNVKLVTNHLNEWMAQKHFKERFLVRIIPQWHKGALFVS